MRPEEEPPKDAVDPLSNSEKWDLPKQVDFKVGVQSHQEGARVCHPFSPDGRM